MEISQNFVAFSEYMTLHCQSEKSKQKNPKKIQKKLNVAHFNKDVAPERTSKVNKRTPTFIPDPRVVI